MDKSSTSWLVIRVQICCCARRPDGMPVTAVALFVRIQAELPMIAIWIRPWAVCIVSAYDECIDVRPVEPIVPTERVHKSLVI